MRCPAVEDDVALSWWGLDFTSVNLGDPFPNVHATACPGAPVYGLGPLLPVCATIRRRHGLFILNRPATTSNSTLPEQRLTSSCRTWLVGYNSLYIGSEDDENAFARSINTNILDPLDKPRRHEVGFRSGPALLPPGSTALPWSSFQDSETLFPTCACALEPSHIPVVLESASSTAIMEDPPRRPTNPNGDRRQWAGRRRLCRALGEG
jgi:hypothetical protein